MKRLAVMLSLSAVLIVAGLALGGAEGVWTKGANLCMECVGLG